MADPTGAGGGPAAGPIVTAQLAAIRACRVKAMDETPIKAECKGAGKLNNGCFWPIWGDTGGGGDMVFLHFPSRAAMRVREGLGETAGKDDVLLSDGYSAYARYAEQTDITLAQCWSHARRGFERAKDIEPAASAEALERIGALYAIERQIREQAISGAAKQAYRQQHAAHLNALWRLCLAHADATHEKTRAPARQLLYDFETFWVTLCHPELPLTE